MVPSGGRRNARTIQLPTIDATAATPIEHQTPGKFRTDLQALRGLAILLVVLHHTGFRLFGAGYLGVDIFFVISGFLITSIVKGDIERGNFSFSAFYFRRAKRLLPAAYVAFLATSLLSTVLLTSVELRDYSKQLVGAITFTGNFALWLQTGYFETAAELKPLLHVWSLSIEEQYYLLLPAALFLAPRKWWNPGTALVLLASLTLSLLLASSRPAAAFYLLPTRAWELAIGSIGALALNGAASAKAATRLYWPAFLALLAILAFPTRTPHPGLNAAVVCAATLVIILRRHPMWNDNGAAKAMARVGDFSYSLYLVHWPLFAFANNAYVGQVPVGVRCALAAISVVLGYLLYAFVERPVRKSAIAPSGRSVGATILASAAIVAVTLYVSRGDASGIDYAKVRRANHGLADVCEFDDDNPRKLACATSANPRILVFGDSFAMALVPGIVATSHVGIAQATRPACGPFFGMAQLDSGKHQRKWSEDCLRFTQAVLDYLASAPSIDVVVLTSEFAPYVNQRPDVAGRLLHGSNGRMDVGMPGVQASLEALRQTVGSIRLLGKKVVVVAPPPSTGIDIGKCLERKATGKLTFGAGTGCRLPVPDYREFQANVLQLMDRLPAEAGVNVVRLDGLLCSRESCATEIDGVFVYRDGGHFSYEGSRLVGRKMDLANLLVANAR